MGIGSDTRRRSVILTTDEGVANGVSCSRKRVNSALKCRPRFVVIRDIQRDDAILREVALLVDVMLDNNGVATQKGGIIDVATVSAGRRGCGVS
jgi:hypothetical protein